MTPFKSIPLKDIVVDAIIGVGIDCYEIAEAAQKNGLANFTGNQHNPEWHWSRPGLNALPLADLEDLYAVLADRKATHAH